MDGSAVRGAGGSAAGPGATGGLLRAPVAVTDRCTGCGACLLTCPAHALRPVARPGASVLAVLADRCTGCLECIEVCPADAIVELCPCRTC